MNLEGSIVSLLPEMRGLTKTPRPHGANRWMEVDAIEDVSLYGLNDSPSAAHQEEYATSQSYTTDSLTVAHIWRPEFVVNGLRVAMLVTNLDDKSGCLGVPKRLPGVSSSLRLV